jgi:hypothetical protein
VEIERTLSAALLGLAVSLLLERWLLSPARDSSAAAKSRVLVAHTLIWLLMFSALAALSGRPWFSLVVMVALQLVLLLVNNAKLTTLGEPFIFQDYEYFTDAIRFPRLFLPFFGYGKTALLTVVISSAVISGWLLEPPVSRVLSVGIALCALTGMLLSEAHLPRPSFQPLLDLQRTSFFTSLWQYARAERERPEIAAKSPIPARETRAHRSSPHIVVVQSESFFDPRELVPGLHPDLLSGFDRLREEAFSKGRVSVPAWGANTVRSEFAFLTGLAGEQLGVHQFNPYRRLVYQGVPSLPSRLRQSGYRTVCVHPYARSFYRRDRVLPYLGFDEFQGEETFTDAERDGYFIADSVLAERINEVVTESTEPLFIFAISMENHGPMDPHPVTPKVRESLFNASGAEYPEELTRYLHHLRNADRMAMQVRDCLERQERSAWLCWYGDHIPILNEVYSLWGRPSGETDYVVWHNRQAYSPLGEQDISLTDLARLLSTAAFEPIARDA